MSSLRTQGNLHWKCIAYMHPLHYGYAPGSKKMIISCSDFGEHYENPCKYVRYKTCAKKANIMWKRVVF